MVKYLYYKTHRRATPMTNNGHRRWLLESLKVVYQKSLSKKSSLFDCHIVYILPIQLTICVRSLNTWRVTQLHITPIQTITCILYNMFPLFLASRTYTNLISPIVTVIKKWTSEIFRVQNSQNSKIRNFCNIRWIRSCLVVFCIHWPLSAISSIRHLSIQSFLKIPLIGRGDDTELTDVATL